MSLRIPEKQETPSVWDLHLKCSVVAQIILTFLTFLSFLQHGSMILNIILLLVSERNAELLWMVHKRKNVLRQRLSEENSSIFNFISSRFVMQDTNGWRPSTTRKVKDTVHSASEINFNANPKPFSKGCGLYPLHSNVQELNRVVEGKFFTKVKGITALLCFLTPTPSSSLHFLFEKAVIPTKSYRNEATGILPIGIKNVLIPLEPLTNFCQAFLIPRYRLNPRICFFSRGRYPPNLDSNMRSVL